MAGFVESEVARVEGRDADFPQERGKFIHFIVAFILDMRQDLTRKLDISAQQRCFPARYLECRTN